MRIYLTSNDGYVNYCQDCTKCIGIEKTEFRNFTIRVFCLVDGKCVK